jgi:hypothetical protein
MINRHKMLNNNCKLLNEGLEYKDLEGLMKATMHVDEFSANMGEDADVMVLSFFVRDKQAARDLVAWFEKGYEFILDSDRSPGEIRPGRYLVYVELRRRATAVDHIQELLDDLSTLTEYEPQDWIVHANDRVSHWNPEQFSDLVPLTPDAYRAEHEQDLNDLRDAAGIPAKKIHDTKSDMKDLQAAAGITVK